VRLEETFSAGCIEKADEIDDSDGEVSALASGLFWGWIKARQAGRGDAHETVQLLLIVDG
jgi:hypothetical protein